MKNHFASFALALAAVAAVAPLAHAASGPTTSATSVVTLTIPSTITFTVQNVPFGTLPNPTANATGQSVAANLQTNYNAVSLQVKAGAAGSRVRTPAATGTLLASDIQVSNGASQSLTITDAPFGSLTGFSPNVIKSYSFPVVITNINNYEQGSYSNSIVFTATGS
ncbi:hypothetical protein IAD21_04097 [Abditibacteriota bacterium]|nr:hypothetical protein IAD21_04097 [Abditibacteriota bacterium]